MSMQALERQIRLKAAEILANPKLRNKDLLAWSTGPVEPEEGEIVIRCERLGINVCVAAEHDKRG